jgi:hypothetical protein
VKKYERDDFLDDEGRRIEAKLRKLEDGMTQEQGAIASLEEEMLYGDLANTYDDGADIAISCCQRISLSESSGAMTPQQIIEEKIVIDSIIRICEVDIEKHGNHNRHWLVRHIQKKIDSIMDAKQTFDIR